MSVDTIRFYEKSGLLPAPPRAESGFRYYGADAIEDLALIRDLRSAGLTLEELRDLLPVCREARNPVDPDLVEMHLRSLDARIGALQSCRQVLQSLLC